jgi:hypothetical protein
MRYRKKPIEIDAMPLPPVWAIEARIELERWLKSLGADMSKFRYVAGDMTIETLEGKMIARPGDYIIRGIQGEYYPCKPNIFEKTYERVDG